MFRKPTQKQIEKREAEREAFRLEREKTELGKIQNLIEKYAVPGSMYDGVSEYVLLSESALVAQVFSEWATLKKNSDAIEATKEINRWTERVRKLEYQLAEIRRIVK